MRISDAEDLSEHAKALNRARWGDRVAVRAAEVVIERADQVPEALKAEVLQALTDDDGASRS
jgi:hypothetical protein